MAPQPPDWSAIHDPHNSWRRKLVGDINELFVVPRYVRLFYETFADARAWSFFEVGAGTGELSRAVLAENRGQIARYLASEYFPEGVEWLKRAGLEAIQADALDLPLDDGQFDAAVAFDVMHHVDSPRSMAREMMRVARGRCLLVEANGLSVFRKLKELTPGHRAAGERSYTPWVYRGFFGGHAGYALERFEIFPFLFPFKCPRWALPGLVAWNHWIEQIPLLRWQCSSVAISVHYRRTAKAVRVAA